MYLTKCKTLSLLCSSSTNSLVICIYTYYACVLTTGLESEHIAVKFGVPCIWIQEFALKYSQTQYNQASIKNCPNTCNFVGKKSEYKKINKLLHYFESDQIFNVNLWYLTLFEALFYKHIMTDINKVLKVPSPTKKSAIWNMAPPLHHTLKRATHDWCYSHT